MKSKCLWMFLEITIKTLKSLKAMKIEKYREQHEKEDKKSEIAFNVFIVYFGGKRLIVYFWRKMLEQGTELLSDTHITQQTQSHCTIKK